MNLKQSVKHRLQRGNPQVADLQKEVAQLRTRVRELTQDVQEARNLHERVAELTDAVAELLVPAMDRDDDRVKAALQTFNRHYS